MTSNSTTALNGAQMMSEFQDVMKTWAAAENSGAPIIQMKADFGVAKIELIKCSAAETAGITNWKVGKELDCLMAHDDNIGTYFEFARANSARPSQITTSLSQASGGTGESQDQSTVQSQPVSNSNSNSQVYDAFTTAPPGRPIHPRYQWREFCEDDVQSRFANLCASRLFDPASAREKGWADTVLDVCKDLGSKYGHHFKEGTATPEVLEAMSRDCSKLVGMSTGASGESGCGVEQIATWINSLPSDKLGSSMFDHHMKLPEVLDAYSKLVTDNPKLSRDESKAALENKMSGEWEKPYVERTWGARWGYSSPPPTGLWSGVKSVASAIGTGLWEAPQVWKWHKHIGSGYNALFGSKPAPQSNPALPEGQFSIPVPTANPSAAFTSALGTVSQPASTAPPPNPTKFSMGHPSTWTKKGRERKDKAATANATTTDATTTNAATTANGTSVPETSAGTSTAPTTGFGG